MTYDGNCDMLKYICPEVEMSTRGRSRVLTFQLRDIYIFARHTSPSCIICFVASLTKIQLSSIKKLHFTGME